MSETTDADYVLGTSDDEVARLGLQHRVWRSVAIESWRRAGITAGSRVIDVGAGPGYATIDLAEIVGSTGEVLALERSARFLNVARAACEKRGLTNANFRATDVMEERLPAGDYDFAWCRWVASFVSSPQRLVQNIAGALRAGGVAIFHEYNHYETWRLAPRRPAVENFAQEVMKSWRAAGGEPDVALVLPEVLREAGMKIIAARPHVRVVAPDDYTWQWPASFIETNLARLQELGRVSAEWAETVRTEFRAAEADPATLCTTPMFLEILARREPS